MIGSGMKVDVGMYVEGVFIMTVYQKYVIFVIKVSRIQKMIVNFSSLIQTPVIHMNKNNIKGGIPCRYQLKKVL